MLALQHERMSKVWNMGIGTPKQPLLPHVTRDFYLRLGTCTEIL